MKFAGHKIEPVLINGPEGTSADIEYCLIQGNKVHSIIKNGQRLFLASDISRALGLRERGGLDRVKTEDLRLHEHNGRQEFFVTNGGLAAMVLRSRKRSSAAMKEWVRSYLNGDGLAAEIKVDTSAEVLQLDVPEVITPEVIDDSPVAPSTTVDSDGVHVPESLVRDLTVFRLIFEDEEPWFVAKDICDAMEHSNSRKAISRLPIDEVKTVSVYTSSGPTIITVVSYSGMRRLLYTTRKESADEVRTWLEEQYERRFGRVAVEAANEQTTDVVPFEFKGNQVRSLMINDEPWFVAKDICDVLNVRNSRQSTDRLDDDEQRVYTVYTSTGAKQVTVVNESGLYHLILTSRKPEAEAFRKWVTSEVLPTLRKTGSYSIDRRSSPPSASAPSGASLSDTTKFIEVGYKNVKMFKELAEVNGLTGSSALAYAYRRAQEFTGVDWAEIFEAKHLLTTQEEYFMTATEIAEELDLRSAQAANRLLEERGYHHKVDGQWRVTEAGLKFIKYFDVEIPGTRRLQRVHRWSSTILPRLRRNILLKPVTVR